MITVPLPRLLDANLGEVCRLHPLAASITLVSPGVSEASLTLAPDETQPAMHQWLELFTQNGSAGFYRVTAISRTYTGETQLTLRHGIDTLSDSVYMQQAEEKTVTVAQLLRDLLSYQTTRVAGKMPWQLGTCQDTTSVSRAFNYDSLAALLSGIEEEKQNYYFTYDFSTSPWTLNFLRKPTAVQSEFRLSRNIESLNVTLDDAELCTQLLLSVNVMTTETPETDPRPVSSTQEAIQWPTITTNESVVRTYNNAAAQAQWGIVQKTASIDTQDDIAGQGFPSADAWAARFMADHSQPTLQIQISGDDLHRITGDAFDETRLGALCRVSLPDYNAAFSERVVGITYPDPYATPTLVTVSLANKLPRFSNAIAQAQSTANSASSTANTAKRSAGGGGGGTAKELESWAMIVKKSKEAQDATGITELYESGILLDAESGVTLYSLKQGFVSQYAELKVQSDQISSLVQTTNGHESRIKQTADMIQTEVTNRENADATLSSRITQTADAITAEVSRATASEGNLSTRITQTADSITSLAQKSGVAGLQEGETLFSRITQNAESITSEVGRATAAEETIGSRITQTEDSITAEVTRATAAEGALSARITVNAEGITSKVSKGDISSTINQTAQGVQIAAGKIDLSGYTSLQTFNAAMSGYAQTFTTVDLYPTNTYTGLLSAANLYVGNQGSPTQATWQTKSVVTSVNHYDITVKNADGENVKVTKINSVNSTTIYYLGHS